MLNIVEFKDRGFSIRLRKPEIYRLVLSIVFPNDEQETSNKRTPPDVSSLLRSVKHQSPLAEVQAQPARLRNATPTILSL
jgi:hypothetical protein